MLLLIFILNSIIYLKYREAEKDNSNNKLLGTKDGIVAPKGVLEKKDGNGFFRLLDY